VAIALGVDTSTPAGSVALAEEERTLAEINLAAGGHHQERLLRAVDLLLDLAGWSLARVDGIGVALGPGTFTGLRIGIASVKGLALARGVPAFGLSTLAAMAFRYRDRGLPVAPMIDAGRNETYSALFVVLEEEVRAEMEERAGPPGQFLRALPPGAVFFCGEGARKYRELILQTRGAGDLLYADTCFLGGTLARWAAGRLRKKAAGSLGDLRPNYLRPPDAEIKPRI
jgi:tRNA threonylcarbamoyladenosine biosynthesis protein TsaB